jgi:hypothetical protein
MNKDRPKFLSVLVLLGVVVGGIVWFWYDDKLDLFDGKFNIISGSDFSQLAEKVTAGAKNFQMGSKSKIQELIKNAASKPTEAVGNIFHDVKDTASQSLRTQIANVLGISSANLSPVKHIAIVRPISQGLSLIVESGAAEINYSIHWGEGTPTTGVLGAGQQKTIDHIWQSTGDYLVTVDIESSADQQKKTFVFPVKILK